MKDKIVVVGGYGHVGTTICKELCERYPGRVYAAGRSAERAERLSRETGGKVKPLPLDIRNPTDSDVLNDAKLVIMCLDQTDTAFVRSCFRNGTHYIDVSANGAFLTQVERCGREAEAHDATAVLSIGLAPGLTNLLALEASKLLEQVHEIDITIMLGLGDRHGETAIAWTVDNLNSRFEVIRNNRSVAVKSFTDGRVADFGTDFGRKKAYRFPFSDQQTIARTLDVPTVSTRLCFDSGMVTGLAAGLRATGAGGFLKAGWVRQAAISGIGKLHYGGERFAVKVDARGSKGNKDAYAECFLQGIHQSDMTAKVAVSVADALCRTDFPHGIYHIEQLFELDDMRDWLTKEASVEIRLDGNLYSTI